MMHGDITAGPETLRVTLRVSGGGGVSHTKLIGKHGGTPLGDCVEKAVKAIRFPAKGGSTKKYTVRYQVGG
jgi:hypothetical protein